MAQVVAKFPPRSVDNHSFGIPDFEPLLNSHQAAQLLDIHHKTLQKLARRGEIHGSHVGKLWRFRASDLNAWLERQEKTEERIFNNFATPNKADVSAKQSLEILIGPRLDPNWTQI